MKDNVYLKRFSVNQWKMMAKNKTICYFWNGQRPETPYVGRFSDFDEDDYIELLKEDSGFRPFEINDREDSGFHPFEINDNGVYFEFCEPLDKNIKVEEAKYRPFKTLEEFLLSNCDEWVVSKKYPQLFKRISQIDFSDYGESEYVQDSPKWLFDNFQTLDGQPIGVEED